MTIRLDADSDITIQLRDMDYYDFIPRRYNYPAQQARWVSLKNRIGVWR